jgi:hypothetical protein
MQIGADQEQSSREFREKGANQNKAFATRLLS